MKSLKEKGITLVALVVTIVIMLILAGVTINIALSENGLFKRAKGATRIYENSSENESKLLEEVDKTITELNKEEKIETANTLKERLNGKNSVIGKKVGGLKGDIIEKYDWQILYVDKNIYLISTDYIELTDYPEKKVNDITYKIKPDLQGEYKSEFSGVIEGYPYDEDTKRIPISEVGKKLNADFEAKEYYNENKNSNLQAIAYMLDTEIWKNKFIGSNSDKIEYIVGSPSIELLFNAYNAKYGTNYLTRVKDNKYGYEISKDGIVWEDNIADMLDTLDTTFVILDDQKAKGMRLASPSSKDPTAILHANYSGGIGYNTYDSLNEVGIRPVICLLTNVQLEEQIDGNFKIKL